MFNSQGANQRVIRGKIGGVWFPGQDGSGDGLSTRTIDVPDEVRQRPSLSDEIINQKIVLAALHLAGKDGLICEPLKPACTRVTHGIGLHHRVRDCRPSCSDGHSARAAGISFTPSDSRAWTGKSRTSRP